MRKIKQKIKNLHLFKIKNNHWLHEFMNTDLGRKLAYRYSTGNMK